ncbi:hypothetical protein [Stenotrophomonas phage vB_SmeS_BUCT709]|nr:hypothetical protein [Stenotrophomonas phage vB_SmeS_BUCT708]WCS67767.1 hypothetical protein [Stenotrophomonas phage vB_SmeS_BUCT709]
MGLTSLTAGKDRHPLDGKRPAQGGPVTPGGDQTTKIP